MPLVESLLQRRDCGEGVLIIFRNQRGTTRGTALYLAAELGLPPASAAIAALPTVDLSSDGFWSEKPPDGGSTDAQASCNFALAEAISMKGPDLAGR